MSEILSKNGYGNYCVTKSNKVSIYNDWEDLIKGENWKKEEIEYGKGKIYKKPGLVREEHLVEVCCVECGKDMLYPFDAEHFPSFCKDKCKFIFENNGEEK